MSKKINMIGLRFNKLIVLEEVEKRSGQCAFKCLCDCGKTTIVIGHNLRRNNTGSCGCLNEERWKNEITKHGDYGSSEYLSWRNMNQRCYNPKVKTYKHYGGRGITVCDEWRFNYLQFLKDMGRKPDGKYTLDRIDNEKGYSKDNCKWSTMTEQNNNRRPFHNRREHVSAFR